MPSNPPRRVSKRYSKPKIPPKRLVSVRRMPVGTRRRGTGAVAFFLPYKRYHKYWVQVFQHFQLRGLESVGYFATHKILRKQVLYLQYLQALKMVLQHSIYLTSYSPRIDRCACSRNIPYLQSQAWSRNSTFQKLRINQRYRHSMLFQLQARRSQLRGGSSHVRNRFSRAIWTITR